MPQFASPRKLKSLDFELLLYYGWISFIGIVDDAKLNNFKLLAFIISTLSSNYISKGSAIRYAESELKNFFYSFNQVYGANEGFMWKINLHFLEHLPLMVKLYGPLPIQTAYFTENTMGIIAKRVKTGTNVPQQVLKKIINYQTIVSFTTVNNTDCSIEFINQVDDLMPKLGLILHEDQSFSIVSKNIKEPNRIRVSNQLICTKEYNDTRAVSTCNHCIRTTKGKFFIVKKIVQSDDTEKIYTLLCNEFLNCRKLSVYDDKDCTNFNYIYTYSKISNNMCSINLNESEKDAIRKSFLKKEDLMLINDRMKMIKFPERCLKSMPELGSETNLKALDFEIILFYGWIVFEGIVDSTRLLNFKQLAYILSTWSSRIISKGADFRYAESEMNNFFTTFNQAYGESKYLWKMNVHFLSHFPKMVEEYGPLPVQAAYFTENTMGLIAKRVKTGTNITQQVMKKMVTYQSVLSYSTNSPNCSVHFMQEVERYLPMLSPIGRSIKPMAENCPNGLTECELNILPKDEGYELIQRISFNNEVLCTKKYNQQKAISTINHCCKTVKGKFYIIEKIVVGINTKKTFLLCNELLNCVKLPLESGFTQSHAHFSYIHTYSKTSQLTQNIPITDVSELCTYTTINNANYLFSIFNKHISKSDKLMH
ncbi:hypothetical protein BLOT_016853 [Blomia tropicalis]|nr:hypothetical protein BLOT_016853 [Blomia tropicalis]